MELKFDMKIISADYRFFFSSSNICMGTGMMKGSVKREKSVQKHEAVRIKGVKLMQKDYNGAFLDICFKKSLKFDIENI